MRALTPIRVEAEGLWPRRHRFIGREGALGELQVTPLATENVFRQADGQEYLIKRETVLPRSYALRQGDLVLATASYTHLTYQAVPTACAGLVCGPSMSCATNRMPWS